MNADDVTFIVPPKKPAWLPRPTHPGWWWQYYFGNEFSRPRMRVVEVTTHFMRRFADVTTENNKTGLLWQPIPQPEPPKENADAR